jgi:hypothetical protein
MIGDSLLTHFAVFVVIGAVASSLMLVLIQVAAGKFDHRD